MAEKLAIDAARNFSKLRTQGVTVRGTIDVIIATRCIRDGIRLLHSDRDFELHSRTHLGATRGGSRGLTFEVRWDRRQGARPGLATMIPHNRQSRAWWLAVGPRLDRGVRPQRRAWHDVQE